MSGKFDKAGRRIEGERSFAYEQERLHEKYELEDENVVIKEKDNMVKFIIRIICGLFKIICVLAAIVFVTIGILTLIYLRDEFIEVMEQIIGEIHLLALV